MPLPGAEQQAALKSLLENLQSTDGRDEMEPPQVCVCGGGEDRAIADLCTDLYTLDSSADLSPLPRVSLEARFSV